MSKLDDLKNLREAYSKGAMTRDQLALDPFDQFRNWFAVAMDSEGLEANAMILGTTGHSMRPSMRTVLLKELRDEGFVFYTSYKSKKGREIDENPQASLLFFWAPLQQQIRIEGSISKIDEESSTKYFQSRPLGSQLGAWASNQSEVLANRKVLEDKLQNAKKKYGQSQGLPRPEYWGGYSLKPDYFEFWQGRMDRLHDRFAYTLNHDTKAWKIERLSP